MLARIFFCGCSINLSIPDFDLPKAIAFILDISSSKTFFMKNIKESRKKTAASAKIRLIRESIGRLIIAELLIQTGS